MSNHNKNQSLIESANANDALKSEMELEEPVFGNEQTRKSLNPFSVNEGACQKNVVQLIGKLTLADNVSFLTVVPEKELNSLQSTEKQQDGSSENALQAYLMTLDTQRIRAYYQMKKSYYEKQKKYSSGRFNGNHSVNLYPPFMDSTSDEAQYFNEYLSCLKTHNYLFRVNFKGLSLFDFSQHYRNVRYCLRLMEKIYEQSQKTPNLEKAYENWKELRKVAHWNRPKRILDLKNKVFKSKQ